MGRKGLSGPVRGESCLVSLLVLLLIPGTFVLLLGLLLLSAWVEERVLSPQSMILQVARTRASTPEYAEAFVAREFDRLLRQAQR
ncbi:MAG: hypothetical protein QOE35_2094 [Actinomycetota bacterium]